LPLFVYIGDTGRAFKDHLSASRDQRGTRKASALVSIANDGSDLLGFVNPIDRARK
jgi:hypothetical protein